MSAVKEQASSSKKGLDQSNVQRMELRYRKMIQKWFAPMPLRTFASFQYRHLLFMAILLTGLPLQAEPVSQHEILVIHSYSTDFQWTNEINDSIVKHLKRHLPQSLIRVEYMDTKNIYSPDYLEHLAELYRYKYANELPDGIILSDNNAMDFFIRHGNAIFPGVPAVATGINGEEPIDRTEQLVSVIAEWAQHDTTINQALKLLPNINNIYLLSDATPTGLILARETLQALSPFEGVAAIHQLHGYNLDELKVMATSFQANDLVYLAPYFRAADGSIYSQYQLETTLAPISKAPIVTSWSFLVGNGALGGHIISAELLGQYAADTLHKFLSGQTVKSYQNQLAISQPRYDYNAIHRFGLNENLLPHHSQVLNQPKSFYQKHRLVVIPATGIIATLALILFLVVLNLKKHRALSAHSQRLLTLDQEIIETQLGLLTTLGGIIEARSHETHNHVLRVAKICKFLGEHLGLSARELNLLETASSMHDVGKIGLPESILHKPHDLSPEERELMKTHSRIGQDILLNSDRELIVMCRNIAYQHHEHWDGSGYPEGIRGEAISIHARITTLADVYDAVSSDRCYKNAWSEQQVLEYITSQKGIIFDPNLVELFMTHFEQIRAIRLSYL